MKAQWLGRIGIAALLAIAVCTPAFAQEQSPDFPSWQLPGWTFTPGLTFGMLHDTNVAVRFPSAGSDGKTESDSLWAMQPSGQLEYRSGRTLFTSGYRGYLRRYFELDELNSLEQHGEFSLREMVTRRWTVFANDAYLNTPTTDRLDIGGIPFQRNGSRYDAFSGGLEGRLTRTTDVTARYEFSWVDFENKTLLLTGGHVHGLHGDVMHRFDSRSSLGGEYSVRWADLDRGLRQLTYQSTGAVYHYRTGGRTTAELAGGLAGVGSLPRPDTRRPLRSRRADPPRASRHARGRLRTQLRAVVLLRRLEREPGNAGLCADAALAHRLLRAGLDIVAPHQPADD